MNSPFTDRLVEGATWLLLAGGAWLLLLVAAAAVERLSRGRVRALATVGCPVSWRPVLLCALGTALAVGTTGPAVARPRQPPALPDLPVPARPVDSASVARPTSDHALVEVVPGDSLWALAQAWAPAAGPAEVQRLVVRTHRLNRAAIGPDPDLLHPGLRLRVPRLPPTSAPS